MKIDSIEEGALCSINWVVFIVSLKQGGACSWNKY